jgi:hypothetical protein
MEMNMECTVQRGSLFHASLSGHAKRVKPRSIRISRGAADFCTGQLKRRPAVGTTFSGTTLVKKESGGDGSAPQGEESSPC